MVDAIGAEGRAQRIGHLSLPDELGEVFGPVTAIQSSDHIQRVVGAADTPVLRGADRWSIPAPDPLYRSEPLGVLSGHTPDAANHRAGSHQARSPTGRPAKDQEKR
ncbi:hypothetical protein GCM10025867_39020 [Frondihabitans sucicola]|uniref:Uncharacterized protein n=1 Tax=Frondihabitans sucicola TaxID=1268041 RepID=A0ABM8GT98_9MICO|nr:hypothetical protein GCM10025867_39020 [Frondihabitans sucicola]